MFIKFNRGWPPLEHLDSWLDSNLDISEYNWVNRIGSLISSSTGGIMFHNEHAATLFILKWS